MKCFLLAVLMLLTIGAAAQQRLGNPNSIRELRARFRALQLTIDQKRRLMILIRRERMQYYLNQRELNSILTDKQKAKLMQWRNQRNGMDKDSTTAVLPTTAGE